MKRYLPCKSVVVLVVILLIGDWNTSAYGEAPGSSYYIEQAQQRFFDQWGSARSLSLAGASIPTSSDDSSVRGNPAGLGFVQSSELSTSYDYNQTGGKAGISEYQHIGSVTYIHPIASDDIDFGSIGLGWTALQGGPDDYPINSEHRTTDLQLSYGRALTDNMSVGYGLTLSDNKVYSNLYGYDMDGALRHSLAISERLGNSTLGLTVTFGSGTYDAEFYGQKEENSHVVERTISAGASHKFSNTTLFAAVDFNDYRAGGAFQRPTPNMELGGKESGSAFTPRAGIESALSESITARLGTKYIFRRQVLYRDELRDLSGDIDAFAWSTGVGIKLPVKYPPELSFGCEWRRNDNTNREAIVTLSLPMTG